MEGSPRKMWVEVKSTGDAVEIELDKNRPIDFQTKEQEILWEKESAKVAIRWKENVDTGKLIPKEVLTKIKNKLEKTPQDEAIISTEKEMANKREKVSAVLAHSRNSSMMLIVYCLFF